MEDTHVVQYKKRTIPELSHSLYNALLSGNVEFNRIKKERGRLCVASSDEARKILPAGRVFEIFMFSMTSDGVPAKYLEFEDAFVDALSVGLDQEKLSQKLCYSNELFRQISEALPKELRNKLKMFVTVDTSFDMSHGIDLVFILGEYYIGVDATIDAFGLHKGVAGHNILRFNYLWFSQKFLNGFVHDVVDRLVSRKHRLPWKADRFLRSMTRAQNN